MQLKISADVAELYPICMWKCEKKTLGIWFLIDLYIVLAGE